MTGLTPGSGETGVGSLDAASHSSFALAAAGLASTAIEEEDGAGAGEAGTGEATGAGDEGAGDEGGGEDLGGGLETAAGAADAATVLGDEEEEEDEGAYHSDKKSTASRSDLSSCAGRRCLRRFTN